METVKKKSKLKTLLIVFVVLGAIWYFFGGGLDQQVANDMQKIENQVALDAEKQYEIAVSGGDKTDIYVHAQLVAAAYLQAKDEVNYKKWKAIEKEASKDAGMPQ